MGDFIRADEVKTKARVPELQAMEPDDLEFIYIDPAERLIENHFNLDLDTDRDPRHWAGRFDSPIDGARLRSEFQADYKRAAFLTIEQMAANPQHLQGQSVKGASWTYDWDYIHPAVSALMARWKKPVRIGRG
jgi:hypothetical protein